MSGLAITKAHHSNKDEWKGYKASFLSKTQLLASLSLWSSGRQVRISRWKDAAYRAQSAKLELGDDRDVQTALIILA